MALTNLAALIAACDCCQCTAPTIFYSTKSASKTKCGFAEFGTPSSPAKIYLVKTQSGTIDETISGYLVSNTYFGSKTYSRPACTSTDTRTMNYIDARFDPECEVDDLPVNIDDTSYGGPNINGDYVHYGPVCGGELIYHEGSGGHVVTSPTVLTFSGESGTATCTLSSEYTTAQLVAEVQAELDAASWSAWSTTPATALEDHSTDELTYTERRVKVRVAHKIPGNGSCYRCWPYAAFTPGGIGGATDFYNFGEQQWNRVVPSSYDVGDPTTWPYFDFTLPMPSYFPAYTVYPATSPSHDGEVAIALDGSLIPPDGYACEGCT